jgi:hypothetical protein
MTEYQYFLQPAGKGNSVNEVKKMIISDSPPLAQIPVDLGKKDRKTKKIHKFS